MGRIGFLFAGQGSQYPGMGMDFYERIPEVRILYEQAEKLCPGIIKMCFESEREQLARTENTQPCLYLADLASAMALQMEGIVPRATAGFSLGELAALCQGGVYTFEEGFSLVCERGKAMAECGKKFEGSMIAILGQEEERVRSLCAQRGVEPVNFNCPGQIVVAGLKEPIRAFENLLKEEKIKAIPIGVSGPFHTRWMREAGTKLAQKAILCDFQKPRIPVYANETGEVYQGEPEEMREALCRQLQKPVRWDRLIQNMWDQGITTFVECGPGKTLSTFGKRICREGKFFSVENFETLKEVADYLRTHEEEQE